MTQSTGLDVGERAPEVRATLVRPDGSAETVALADLLDDGPVLLSFYTNDFTPDCIEEWCSFRDYDWFASSDRIQIVGVSRSRAYTHRKFIDYLDLGFPLYADRNLDISDGFGVTYRAFNVAARSRRSCFLLDPSGEVRYRWTAEHPLDPTRDQPPLSEIHEAIVAEFGGGETDSFGF